MAAQVASSKLAEEEAIGDAGVFPAVDDGALKERGPAPAKKTYCVSLSGAVVPAHRSRKSAVGQMSYVTAASAKGVGLEERKNVKVIYLLASLLVRLWFARDIFAKYKLVWLE